MTNSSSYIPSTSDEMVDIVDENCNVLSQISKNEAHEKGLLHMTAIANVINSKGEWVLVKQAKQKQEPDQLTNTIGGHIQAGESQDDALKRETFEEAGIKDFEYKLVGKKIFSRFVRNRQENHYFIYYEVYSDEDLQVSEESSAFEAFSPEALKNKLQTNPENFGGALRFVLENFYPDF